MAFNFLRDSAESHFHRALVTGDGTAADPVYTFTGGSSSGFYWDPNSATDNDGTVAVSIGGVKKFEIGTSGVTATGTVTAGSFSTSGTLGAGAITCTSVDSSGSVAAGTLTITSGSITDSDGAISFGNDNLTTTGSITAGVGGAFTVAAADGDVTTTGTLDVGGRINANVGTGSTGLAVDANATIGGQLTVTGHIIGHSSGNLNSTDNTLAVHTGEDASTVKICPGGDETRFIVRAGDDSGHAGEHPNMTVLQQTGSARWGLTMMNPNTDFSLRVDRMYCDETGDLSLTVAGNATVAGTLGVTGAITGNASSASLVKGDVQQTDGTVILNASANTFSGNAATATSANTALTLTTNRVGDPNGDLYYNIPWLFHGQALSSTYSDNTAYDVRVDSTNGPKYNPVDDAFSAKNILINSGGGLDMNGQNITMGGGHLNSAASGTFTGNVTCGRLVETTNYKRVWIKPSDCWLDNDSATSNSGAHDTDAVPTYTGNEGVEGGFQNKSGGDRSLYIYAGPFPPFWRPKIYFYCVTEDDNTDVAHGYGTPIIYKKGVYNIDEDDQFIQVLSPAKLNSHTTITSEAAQNHFRSTNYSDPSTDMFVMKILDFEHTYVFHGGYIDLEYSAS
jgi:hypothetical protein